MSYTSPSEAIQLYVLSHESLRDAQETCVV